MILPLTMTLKISARVQGMCPKHFQFVRRPDVAYISITCLTQYRITFWRHRTTFPHFFWLGPLNFGLDVRIHALHLELQPIPLYM